VRGTKTSLFLVELMLSLLLFAFCAAVCIQLFNAAGKRTRDAEALSKAVFAATQAAELYKSVGGDLEKLDDLLGRTALLLDDTVSVYYDADWNTTVPPFLDSAYPSKARYILSVMEMEDYAMIEVFDVKSSGAPFLRIDVKAVA
jgi:type II secretory pathway pseudopilin PulG